MLVKVIIIRLCYCAQDAHIFLKNYGLQTCDSLYTLNKDSSSELIQYLYGTTANS